MTTAERLLLLLRLLQTRRQWSSRALAERLEIEDRTLRRDVERLRSVGYNIRAVRGRYGGYQLAAGAQLPPLLFDETEVLAIVASLITCAAGNAVDPKTATSAIAKMQQALPDHLTHRAADLTSHVSVPAPSATVTPVGTVGELALACRDSLQVRFSYTKLGEVAASQRTVCPLSVVPFASTWYLVAWDIERDDWRLFRLDRMADVDVTATRFSQNRDLPGGESAEVYVARKIRRKQGPISLTVTIDMPLQAWRQYAHDWASRSVTVEGSKTSWPITADSAREVASQLIWIPHGVSYEVHCPDPSMAAELAAIFERFSMTDANS